MTVPPAANRIVVSALVRASRPTKRPVTSSVDPNLMRARPSGITSSKRPNAIDHRASCSSSGRRSNQSGRT
jgi:hypothetical protein